VSAQYSAIKPQTTFQERFPKQTQRKDQGPNLP
jgi:hypothetical protein